MGTLISLEDYRTPSPAIDVNIIKKNNILLNRGLIEPAIEDTSYEIAEEHDAEPIKSMEDIYRISEYLIKNQRYRDNMLFIVGINFGLRVSDLITLRFSHLITDDFSFKNTFPILEKKTKKTRKNKKNRYITINNAVIEAVTLYLEHTPGVSLSDYLFRSQSNNGKNKNKPMHRSSVDDILKGIAEDLHLNCRIATHSLRKTFGYHQMVMSGNNPRKLLILQKIFGHSSSIQTLDYIGITIEEIESEYLKLNLGGSTNYLIDSRIGEDNTVA